MNAQIIPRTLNSFPGRPQHKSCYAYLLAVLVHMDGSDQSPDAHINPWMPKSIPGRPRQCPDLHITSLAMPACLARLFISIAQIISQTPRSLPRHPNNSLYTQINSETLILQILLCFLAMLYHFNGPHHPPDDVIRPGRSNHSRHVQSIPHTIKLQVLPCLLTCCASSFRSYDQSPDGSDHPLDAQITPWTLQLHPRPSNDKS